MEAGARTKRIARVISLCVSQLSSSKITVPPAALQLAGGG